MQRILITCLMTGTSVPTGLTMSPDTFASADLERSVMLCPVCPHVHHWDKAMAFLEEDNSSSRAAASARAARTRTGRRLHTSVPLPSGRIYRELA